MKHFFVLALLFTLLPLPHARAEQLKLVIGCPLIRNNLDPIPQLQSPRAWSLCGQQDLKSARLNLNFQVNVAVKGTAVEESLYPDRFKRVLNAINFAQTYSRDGLVEVTSEYLDIRSGQMKKVSGIGSLIATARNTPLKQIAAENLMEGRYFVLTAGHVSQGGNLQLKNANGPLPIKGVYQDGNTDLALIEIDMGRLNYYPIPLGYYVGDKANPYADGYLMSFLSKNYEYNDRENLIDMYTDVNYRIKFIDGLKGYTASYGGISGVLVPSWLQTPAGKEINPNYVVPRGAVTGIQLLSSFPKGFSGAPVEVAYYYGGMHFYNLAGVLTLSTQDSNTSKATGPVTTAPFIDTILKGKYNFAKTTQWFLVGDAFARVQKDITLFVKSGPIGNGVIIDGKVLPDKINRANNDIRIQIQNNGVSPAEADSILKILRDSKPESLGQNSLGQKMKLQLQ